MNAHLKPYAAALALKFSWLNLEAKTIHAIAEHASRFFETKELNVLADIRSIVEPRSGVLMQDKLLARIQELADIEERGKWQHPNSPPASDDSVLLLTGEGEYLICRYDVELKHWLYRKKPLSELVGVVKWRFVDLGE